MCLWLRCVKLCFQALLKQQMHQICVNLKLTLELQAHEDHIDVQQNMIRRHMSKHRKVNAIATKLKTPFLILAEDRPRKYNVLNNNATSIASTKNSTTGCNNSTHGTSCGTAATAVAGADIGSGTDTNTHLDCADGAWTKDQFRSAKDSFHKNVQKVVGKAANIHAKHIAALVICYGRIGSMIVQTNQIATELAVSYSGVVGRFDVRQSQILS